MPKYMRSLVALAIFSFSLHAQRVESRLFDGLRWRNIGPFRGGRVLAVTGVPGSDNTFYFGAVCGGIWKTTDAGTVWRPIFDSQNIASIGALEAAPSNPEILYAGTGEADMRSDISVGNGMYKSTDAGRTWRNIGLQDSQQIGRIVVDPADPNLVYAAVLGHAYGPNPERGVFRSRDGGQTWQKILYKSPDVGAIDLAIVPEQATVLYASLWQARRTPWSQYPPLGGSGSGLFKSVDGGNSWTQLTGSGLPNGPWGRAGVAVARGTAGRRVYAVIDAKTPGLYRSDDAGATWRLVSKDPRITSRAWYFSGVTVDPKAPDTVYLPNVALYKSVDGGQNFSVLKGAPGGDDYHSLWIDPRNSMHMLLGSDQGTNVSLDGGQSWSTWYNQPTAQMYHVVTDNQHPYWVYGSQQDSGSIVVPSATAHGGITMRDWYTVGGGESGYIAPDPKNANIVYAGDTNGQLMRWDKRSAEAQIITPTLERGFGVDISKRHYRFPWTTPLIFSKLEPNVLFYGSQYLLKTSDEGLSWSEISPDLTGGRRSHDVATDTAPLTPANARERGYGVIFSIAPSPLQPGTIWSGSDSGLIYVTRDGGKNWSNVTPTGLSPWSKIAQLEASRFDAGVAYAAVDRHRLDDYKPHIYRTQDFGKSWVEINQGLRAPEFANAVREDPVRRSLLYAATEMGVAVSFDTGENWQSLQLNLPVTSVRDLTVHGNDLVIATHGRGFWILDDISALRQMDRKIAAASAWLYKPAEALRLSPAIFQGTPLPVEEPVARNPPDGAIFDYYLPEDAPNGVALEVLDQAGHLVRRMSSSDRIPERKPAPIADVWLPAPSRPGARAGMDRYVWDLRYQPPESGEDEEDEPEAQPRGPLVVPGTYRVRLRVAGQTLEQPFTVALDPRSQATGADLARAFALGQKALSDLTRGQQFAAHLRALGTTRPANPGGGITAPVALAGDPSRRGVTAINADLNTVLAAVNSSDRTPPRQAYVLYEKAHADLLRLINQWNEETGNRRVR